MFAVNGRSCRDTHMTGLIRCLFVIEAWYGFEMTASHLPGRDNVPANDLSRNRRSSFLSKVNSPDETPTCIPPELPGLLLDREGWTSRRWTERFCSILAAEWLTQPEEPISPD